MPRVLLLMPAAPPGGAERALVSVARRLPNLGWECEAVSLEDGPAVDDLRGVDCPTAVIELGRTRYVWRSAAVLARLVPRARACDVVLGNLSKGHLFGGGAALLARRPAVYWQQAIPQRDGLSLAAAKVPAAVVLCSSDDAVVAQRRLTRRPVRKVHLGVELDAVRPHAGTGTALRARLGWDDHPTVGIVGRLQEWKGQREFLDAAAEVARAVPDARFAVVGGAVLSHQDDAYEQGLHERARALGIADVVHFAGHQPDVYPWYDALDVVVNASHGEPFGLVLVEAMALGRPLIATAAGGPLEIVEDGVSGLLVPVGDSPAMAAAIVRVLTEPGLSERLGAAARDRADHFSADRMAAEVVAVLDEVRAGAQRRTSR